MRANISFEEISNFLAANRLAELQRELRDTEAQIDDANDELAKLQQEAMERSMTEAEKDNLRRRLAGKIQKVCQVSYTNLWMLR